MPGIGYGPQTPNFVTTRPSSDPIQSSANTWFRDCTSPTAKDGTVLSASWLNMVTGQLRNFIDSTGVVLNDTNDNQLRDAAKVHAASRSIETYVNTQVLVGSGTVANQEYTVLSQTISGAVTCFSFASIQFEVNGNQQANTSIRVRVRDLSNNAVVYNSPFLGHVTGNPYVNDMGLATTFGSVPTLDPTKNYEVSSIIVSQGYSNLLRFYNPSLITRY